MRRDFQVSSDRGRTADYPANVTGSGFSVAYTRQANNLISGMTYSNGITSTRNYDADKRLLQIAYANGANTLSQAAHTLNTLGQRPSITRADGMGDNYAYNAKEQVIGADYQVASRGTPGVGGGSSSAFAYDPMDNRESMIQQLMGSGTNTK